MIEDTLEEELLEEFKGGTLSLQAETKSGMIRTESSAATTADNSANNNNNWSTNLIAPLANIQNKISATLWSPKPAPKEAETSTTLQPTICITENPTNFFTFRESVLARALNECKEQFLDEEADGPLLEAFLLTQISHWNSDKERLLLLTPQSLVVAKYDFIALKRLSYKKLPLDAIDEVVFGELVYPNGSLIPQMNGFVDGLSSVLETCLFAKWSKSEANKPLNFYEPRNRNMKGVRLFWNKNQPTNFGSQWNPFTEDLPFCTFTFHPLYYHKDCADEKLRSLYNLEMFVDKLYQVLAELPRNSLPNSVPCAIYEKDIVLQSYVGIGSVIHNRNSLGFFKVRGKFSF